MYYNNKELKPIPACAGIGLRPKHYQDVIETNPAVGWFEVHSENYFGKDGKPHFYLEKICQNYPLSFHGIGLSLGSADAINLAHLATLKKLIDRYLPTFVSEHLCWSSVGGHYLHDLLPLPYTEEALNLFVKHIHQVQEILNRQILIENISSYLQFTHTSIPEYQFVTEIAQRTGCGIVLDINNLYVNSVNHGWNAKEYLYNIPTEFVHEIHLAGFTENQFDYGAILIDTHSKPVAAAVWELYSQALQHLGAKPTLIEWDKDIPDFNVLLEEAQKANQILRRENVVIA